jgi:hypothetical protein
MLLARLLNACHHFPGFVYAAVRLVEATSTIEVDVRPRRGSKARCSCCGKPAPGYDVLPVRRFEFIPIWGYAVMLLYAMRRVQCARCGVKVEHPPGVGSPAAAPGTGERGGPRGPRVRRRLRSARHPGRAPWAGARAPQPGWRLRAVSGIRPEHGVAARIATRGRSQHGCVHARVPPNGRLRIVQPPAHGACCPCGKPWEGV